MDNSRSNQGFKTGDTAQLKSGGPIMTVNNIEKKGEICCQWFLVGKVEVGYFPHDSLKLFVK